jgi:hypothetical protein
LGVECNPENGQQSYWSSDFSIRDSLGNSTKIGRMLGIHTRDKKVSLFSPRGRAIFDFLNRMAWLKASGLTQDRTAIEDSTGYKARLSAESRIYQAA